MPPCLLLLAEVVDKEPTAAWYWAVALLLAAAGHRAARWRRWAVLVVWPVALLHAGAAILHVNDPCIRAALTAEAGPGYVLQIHASVLLTLLVPAWAVARHDLPEARAWWMAVRVRRPMQRAVELPPYRRTTPSPRALVPWRLAVVLGLGTAVLLAVALIQWDRVLTRCTWEP